MDHFHNARKREARKRGARKRLLPSTLHARLMIITPLAYNQQREWGSLFVITRVKAEEEK